MKLFIQTTATTLVMALAAVGVAQATTVGNDVSTGAVTASGALTVAGASTLQAAASITSTTNPQLTVKYDSSNYWSEGVSATGAVTFTRYGSTLQNGFTFADTMNIATSTTKTVLTVNSSNTSNATTTLAVYQAGIGDIVNFYDGSTAVFTVLNGGKIGVSSSTPFGLLSVNSSAGVDPFVVGSSTATTFIVARNLNIGVASTSPWGLLSVEQGTETNSLVVANTGSTTPSFIIKGVNGDGRVGIGTTTPGAMFAVGNGSSATTTFDFSKPCFRMQVDSAGTIQTIYYWPSLVTGNVGGWATSTTSCY